MITRGTMALQWLAALDIQLFLGLNRRHRSHLAETLIRWVSRSGDGYVYVAMGASLPWLYPEQGRGFLLSSLLAFLIELPVYWILKNSFKRRRPFRVVQALAPALNPSDEFSFPSGHTTAAFMMAGITSVWFPALSVLMFAWATMVGLSRVLLKVHFVSDVLAGIILGTLIATLSLALIG